MVEQQVASNQTKLTCHFSVGTFKRLNDVRLLGHFNEEQQGEEHGKLYTHGPKQSSEARDD